MIHFTFFSPSGKSTVGLNKYISVITIFLVSCALVNAQQLVSPEKIFLSPLTVSPGSEILIRLSGIEHQSLLYWEGPEGWLLNGEAAGPSLRTTADNSVIICPDKSGIVRAYVKQGDSFILIAAGIIQVSPVIQLSSATDSRQNQKIQPESEHTPERDNTIEVFPNPFENMITVTSSTSGEAALEVLDNEGRIIEKLEKAALPAVFGEKLSAGVYMLKITTADNVTFSRVIKN
jgi:hypothetical protein